jgi:DNA-binding CsgD family transcriptional regulator
MNPCIAIIDPNTLSALALKDILWELFHEVEIRSYGSMKAFSADCDHYFVHYFISEQILLENAEEFEPLKKQCIVLSSGRGSIFQESGYKVIDSSLPEKELIGAILQLHRSGHPSEKREAQDELLSAREKDVLSLLVKGLINKEIADHLNISPTTVIFHRNNICEKLGTRSLGKLTIYAVLQGIIKLNDLQ